MDATSEIEKSTKDYIAKSRNLYEYFKEKDTLFLEKYQSNLKPKGFWKKLFFVFSNSERSLEYYTILKILKERER